MCYFQFEKTEGSWLRVGDARKPLMGYSVKVFSNGYSKI